MSNTKVAHNLKYIVYYIVQLQSQSVFIKVLNTNIAQDFKTKAGFAIINSTRFRNSFNIKSYFAKNLISYHHSSMTSHTTSTITRHILI